MRAKEIREGRKVVYRRGRIRGIGESEKRKKGRGGTVGSEFLLYSERCIAQKLLAGELPSTSMGFHRLRCPSNSSSTPFLKGLRGSRWIQWIQVISTCYDIPPN